MAEGKKLIEVLDSDDELTEVEQMRLEMSELREIVKQQRDYIQHMDNPVVKKEPNVNPEPKLAKSIVKPRDIPTLELHQLEGLDAAARLQLFFELVEQSAEQDSVRVQIAKSRLGSELAMLIHNYQEKQKGMTWRAFCHILKNEFSVDINLDRAWQELESNSYDWAESPQSYTNQFICQFAILETRFPHEKFPNRDKTIKRKIWHGMTKEAKERLEGFLEEDYPLNKFIDRVEHERQLLLQLHAPTVHHLPKPKKEITSPEALQARGPSTLQEENPQSSRAEINSLKKQMQYLMDAFHKSHTPSPPPPPRFTSPGPLTPSDTLPRSEVYCPCCRSNRHNLPDCPHKPERGACFDCRRKGCRRGNRYCPGRVNQNTST